MEGFKAELIVFRGLPGTGKSYLIELLQHALPKMYRVSRDDTRAQILLQPSYSDEEKYLCNDLCATMVRFLLQNGSGSGVVIDGFSFTKTKDPAEFIRKSTQGVSRRVNVLLVDCSCADKMAVRRIVRDIGTHPAGDRNEALYSRQKAIWEDDCSAFCSKTYRFTHSATGGGGDVELVESCVCAGDMCGEHVCAVRVLLNTDDAPEEERKPQQQADFIAGLVGRQQ
eukprot:GDKI01049698.1.p1 GENE.GDKI01049698.1~~GDKI01049698.1.p1  ORF type:complete len:226 (-),score=45.38 GDKI01049698.1:375-1052(-)